MGIIGIGCMLTSSRASRLKYGMQRRFSRNQLSGVYVTVIVVGYMLKDRLKEWGKRYLQPSAMKFGFEFPDRTVKVCLSCWFCPSSVDPVSFSHL